MNALRAPLTPLSTPKEIVPYSDFTAFPWSWRSCRLKKIALRAPHREICWR
jgi:hypothetical protein